MSLLFERLCDVYMQMYTRGTYEYVNIMYIMNMYVAVSSTFSYTLKFIVKDCDLYVYKRNL